MGGWAEGQTCADPKARTPIGASGNLYSYNYYNIIANLIARLRVHIIISLNQLKIYIYIILCTLSLSGHIHRFVLICFPRFYSVSCTPVQSTEVISMSRQVMTSDPVSMGMLECGVLLKSLLSKLWKEILETNLHTKLILTNSTKIGVHK